MHISHTSRASSIFPSSSTAQYRWRRVPHKSNSAPRADSSRLPVTWVGWSASLYRQNLLQYTFFKLAIVSRAFAYKASSSSSSSARQETCFSSLSSCWTVDNTLAIQNSPFEATAAVFLDASPMKQPSETSSTCSRKQHPPSVTTVIWLFKSPKHNNRRSRQLLRNSSEKTGVGMVRSCEKYSAKDSVCHEEGHTGTRGLLDDFFLTKNSPWMVSQSRTDWIHPSSFGNLWFRIRAPSCSMNHALREFAALTLALYSRTLVQLW